MKISEILRKHYLPNVVLGTDSPKRENLVLALEAHRRRRQKAFILILVVFLVAFLLSVYATLKWIQSPEEFAGLISVLGVTASGAAVWVYKVTKEWTQADLLILLVTQSSEQQMHDLLQKLIGKI
jgi:hypothetical protein